MSSKNPSLQLSPPQPEELVLEIAPQNGQTSPVFSVTKSPDEAARIVGNATFHGDVAMTGALSVEGGLSVSGRVICDDRDFLIVKVEDFTEMTLEEMLSSEDESIRKCSKIIYDKVMEQV